MTSPAIVREALEAMIAIRDDLLMRAEIENGEQVVAVGCGVWIKLNDAIRALSGSVVK